jgi:hypothetical protein
MTRDELKAKSRAEINRRQLATGVTLPNDVSELLTTYWEAGWLVGYRDAINGVQPVERD